MDKLFAASGYIMGAFFIAWLIDLEIRQRRTSAELARETQINANARIRSNVQKLSDAEIDALIDDHFGSNPEDDNH